jgi:hypothetical protein
MYSVIGNALTGTGSYLADISQDSKEEFCMAEGWLFTLSRKPSPLSVQSKITVKDES